MPQNVQGVIARSKGAPVELVDITIPDPGPNDVVVRIQACGVCRGINAQVPGPPTVISSPIWKVISPASTQATSSLSWCR